ncbi:Na+/H+ antiporter subunit E [Wolbachia endosymbiont of Dirofilaria (Dirofilaria) immitis]|uniref:Na+/H+ antiporter subunit E n=1 Tax=Wolbachia endosymbiont of Dirofilaria (Dirofilaria) immitis TaxID=1812115 RepID=UPI00158A21EC|nr:Na+/H+ antiporter subunit E [Wolbachia endosymbiont of Dirofilaria (Dirofilaria) immitis]QKX02002.1 Na+/H+ antiporter subunit E [Wolbachia endosymbiont of Dirofilaria (Dirofilaria) immitis]
MNLKQKIKFFSLSFVILFSLWTILSGYFELFFVLCGVFSSVFTLFIFKRLINVESTFSQILSNTSKLSFYKLLVNYIPWLVYQIILSSIYVIKKVFQTELKLKPIVIIKKYKGHDDKSITLFANSVTITPGTLTIDVARKQQTYLSTICLIDESLESDVSKIENEVLKILNLTK